MPHGDAAGVAAMTGSSPHSDPLALGWVPDEFLPDRPEDRAEVWKQRALGLLEQKEAAESALRWIAQEAESGMRDGVLRHAALLRIRDSAYSVVGVPYPAMRQEDE